jgi:hypothetical protein
MVFGCYEIKPLFELTGFHIRLEEKLSLSLLELVLMI